MPRVRLVELKQSDAPINCNWININHRKVATSGMFNPILPWLLSTLRTSGGGGGGGGQIPSS